MSWVSRLLLIGSIFLCCHSHVMFLLFVSLQFFPTPPSCHNNTFNFSFHVALRHFLITLALVISADWWWNFPIGFRTVSAYIPKTSLLYSSVDTADGELSWTCSGPFVVAGSFAHNLYRTVEVLSFDHISVLLNVILVDKRTSEHSSPLLQQLLQPTYTITNIYTPR